METKPQEKKEEAICVLALTANNYKGLESLLEVARRHGTKQEAILALNWMGELERMINKYQQQKAKEVVPEKETALTPV